jgi:signal peptidase II
MPVIAVLVLVIDQVTKYLVASNLPLGGTWSPLSGPLPLFQIVHAYNTGAAFGLFQNMNPVFIVVAIIVSAAISVYARQLRSDQLLLGTALGLMLGGALGNVIDRVRIGHVLDFFDIGIGTLRNASNVADWCIVLGVSLLAIVMWREGRPAHLSDDVRSN